MMRGFAIHPRRIMSTKAFDVFLSYNSQDEPHVRSLYAALTSRGIQPWFDKEHLLPGDDWQTHLERAIKNACAFAVCISGHSLGPWQNQEVKAGINLAVKKNRRVIPVMLPSAPKKPKQPLFLGNWHQADLRTFAETELDRLVQGIKGRESPHDPPVPPNPSTTNPFLFGCPATGPHFFGREKLCRRFQNVMDRNESISLVGDALSGKSSLMAAWEQQAQRSGRMVKLLNGNQVEGDSYTDFIRAIVGHCDSTWTIERAVTELEHWTNQVSKPLRPVILIDAAEQALRQLPHRFFERMRGLVERQRLSLITASRIPLADIELRDGKTSPLAPVLQQEMIGLLDEHAAQHLCQQGSALFKQKDEELIHLWAGKHPYHLNTLGHALWQIRQEGQDTEEALHKYQRNAKVHLDKCWKSLSHREQEIMTTVLKTGQNHSSHSLHDRGLLDQGQPFGEVVRWWWGERA